MMTNEEEILRLCQIWIDTIKPYRKATKAEEEAERVLAEARLDKISCRGAFYDAFARLNTILNNNGWSGIVETDDADRRLT